MEVEKMSGVVKWFNNAKGFGFITANNLRGDVFAHYSQIQMEGFLTLNSGQEVQFEVEQTPNGYNAKNIFLTNCKS